MHYHPSTNEIERQIAAYPLQFDPVKDNEVEWEYQAPPFISAFVELLETSQHIPSQGEFAEHYLKRNRQALQADFARKWRDPAVRNLKKLALLARLRRAYPSFVRDAYFLGLLRENGISAHYDLKQDIQDGVDLIVYRSGQALKVHLFLDSERARAGRVKKDRRHNFDGRHLDVVFRKDECKCVGQAPFWLPTKRHVELLKRRLDQLSATSGGAQAARRDGKRAA